MCRAWKSELTGGGVSTARLSRPVLPEVELWRETASQRRAFSKRLNGMS